MASWTLIGEDWQLVGNKTAATRLGFALILKFFEIEARFPRVVDEFPSAAVAYVHLLRAQAARDATVNSLKSLRPKTPRRQHGGDAAHARGVRRAHDRGSHLALNQRGDCLLMLSASGETPVSLHLARRASNVGARVLAITTREDSSLAAIADAVVAVPAHASRQFGGSLFEQAALIVLDALIVDLTQDDPGAYEVMSRRHTNLE